MRFNIFKLVKRVFTKKRSPFTLPAQLSDTQKKIITIIDEEITKSTKFGLEISQEHQLKEKYIILLALQELKNISGPSNFLTFDLMMEFFYGAISRALEDESQYYFEKLKKEGRVANMYQAHLYSVAGRILNAIYNREL